MSFFSGCEASRDNTGLLYGGKNVLLVPERTGGAPTISGSFIAAIALELDASHHGVI